MSVSIIGPGRIGSSALNYCEDSKIKINNIVRSKDRIEDLNFDGDDFAVEFTFPDAAFDNIKNLLRKNVNVVSGTTGWISKERESYLNKEALDRGLFCLYSENFSVSMMIFISLVAKLSKMISNLDDDICVQELHHILKKDAPSGTAMKIASEIVKNCSRKNEIKTDHSTKIKPNEVSVSSARVGLHNSEHSVVVDSLTDRFVMSHSTKDFRSFGIGAVKCGIFAKEKGMKGFIHALDFLDDLL